jgi:hypothetical protein
MNVNEKQRGTKRIHNKSTTNRSVDQRDARAARTIGKQRLTRLRERDAAIYGC